MVEILVRLYFTLPSTSVQLETLNIDHSYNNGFLGNS